MWPMLIPHDIYWPKINEKPTKKHHDMHKHVGLSENDTKNAKKWKIFLGSNGLVSAPTFSKSSQHTIMILYSRIFAFFCIALDALRTYVDYDDVDKLDGICLIHSACRWRHFNAFVRVEFEDYSSEAYVLLIPRWSWQWSSFFSDTLKWLTIWI